MLEEGMSNTISDNSLHTSSPSTNSSGTNNPRALMQCSVLAVAGNDLAWWSRTVGYISPGQHWDPFLSTLPPWHAAYILWGLCISGQRFPKKPSFISIMDLEILQALTPFQLLWLAHEQINSISNSIKQLTHHHFLYNAMMLPMPLQPASNALESFLAPGQ